MRFRTLLLTAATALLFSGCLVQYYAESDLDGLPCDGEGRCEPGYFCKDDVCVQSDTLQENDACDSTEECGEGLYCLNAYDENCIIDEFNCALGNSANSGKRCRAACDPFSADLAQCPTGNRCQLVSEDSGLSIKGFCQEGVCSEHTDCGINNGLNNYCTSVSNGTGSGFCLVGCEPLQCTYPNSCNDCPTSSQGCEPFDPDGTGAIAFGCFVPGNRSAGEPCNWTTEVCTIGSFCLVGEAGSTSGTCRRYCSPTGANPACPTGDRCYTLTNNVGYCAP